MQAYLGKEGKAEDASDAGRKPRHCLTSNGNLFVMHDDSRRDCGNMLPVSGPARPQAAGAGNAGYRFHGRGLSMTVHGFCEAGSQ